MTPRHCDGDSLARQSAACPITSSRSRSPSTQLVVHTLPADRQHAIANTPAAVRRVLKAEVKRNSRRAGSARMLVVCEATGGYERHVLDAAVSSASRPTRRTAPR